MKMPQINPYKASDFEQEILKLIPAYLPQWKPAKEEIGWAVAKAFSNMSEEIVQSLNRVPEKLFLSYLDRLQIEPQKAESSKTAVQFEVRKKGIDSVYVPQGTQLISKQKLTFETLSAFTAQKAKLLGSYLFKPQEDAILNIGEALKNHGKALFESKSSLQSHALYLREDKLFRFKKNSGGSDYLTLFLPYTDPHIRWFYWGEEAKGKASWIPFSKTYGTDYEVGYQLPTVLTKTSILPSLPTRIQGEEGYWIKAEVSKLEQNISLDDFSIHLELSNQLDAMFSNDVAIDLKTKRDFYPFGKEPQLGDAWYLASEEIFSKSNHQVSINVKGLDSLHAKGLPVTLSWEYNNGKAWQGLEVFLEKNNLLSFTVPQAIKLFSFNDIENFWIRVRIVSGGYQEQSINRATVITTVDGNKSTFQIEQNSLETIFHPPHLRIDTLRLKGKSRHFQSIISDNNLDYQKHTSLPTPAFQRLEDEYPSLYLGFDQAFDSGLVSLFFSVEIQQQRKKRRLRTLYYTQNHWKELKIEDQSNALQRNGSISFLAPLEQEKKSYFSTLAYWIKFELIEEPLQASRRDIKTSLKLYLGKSDQGDILTGIYSNTVWAIQQKSIKDELLGSSDGTAQQHFQLKNNPAFEVNVWVREPFLPKSTEEYYEDKYQQGYWLAYREIDHLFNAHVDERVFWLNSNEGVIHFGDGEEGKIPPLARDNIRVSYRYGGGVKSNGEASSIKKLLSTLPSIQKVSNPLAITGGADQEPIAELIEKAPANIRHHNRAVCERDIEALVYKVSRSIGRAKLFLKPQGFGEQYLVVVPRDSRAMPQASLTLREKIESYLESRISATSSIEVVSPEYLLVHVRATLHTKTPALADSIYQTALRQLENYLHPLTGKPNQQGWAFGESITLSDVLGWLEEIEQVEYISDIEILLQSGEEQELLNEVNNHYLNLPPYALLASGEHTIKVKEV